ncbi:hypothetical protein N9I33_00755, partial [Paracoccaceae bacterium]|nr:hypothetical protein [Paracoccaceae bacterium]
MLQNYIFLLHFLLFSACSNTQNNVQNKLGSSTQNSLTTSEKVNPDTAYLGKWQLLQLDGAPFVAV